MDIRPVSNPVPQAVIADKNISGTNQAAATRDAATPVLIASAVQHAEQTPNLAQVNQAVKNINRALQDQSQDVEFSVDSESERTVIKVVDQKTKEVLRQIPSEEVVEIAKALDRLQGLIIKQTA